MRQITDEVHLNIFLMPIPLSKKLLFKYTLHMFSHHISYKDVQYGDIDHMDRHIDFTYNKKKYAGLPEFVRSLKKDGLRYIIILVSMYIIISS